MAKKQQHTAAILMAVLILVASIGISVNEHVCLSSNLREVSLLPIEKCESRPVVQHSCCSSAKSGFCALEKIEEQNHQKDSKSCCTYHSEYIVLDTDLVPPTFAPESQQPSLFYLTAFIGHLETHAFNSVFHFTLSHLKQNPAVSANGQETCARLQVFLC